MSGAAGVATFTLYMIGSGRAFGHDAAVTMDRFVDGPPSWALTRQYIFNNHPVFSLAESVMADVVGTGEVAMRVLPALFAAAAVGLLVWRLGVRWGWLAGVSAGVTLAAHPMLVPLARDVRGYSLAVLAIVVMGLAVLDSPRPWLFGVAAAVGIGTHLYVVVPFVALLAYLYVGGELDRRRRTAAMRGMAGGMLVYIGMLDRMGNGGRVFRPSFPLDAGYELLGGGVMAVGGMGVIIAIAAAMMRVDRQAAVMGGVLLAGVLVPWLIGPPDLYPRFVYWAVPGLAVLVGWVVSHNPRAVILVIVVVAGFVVPQVDGWTRDEIPNRELAQHLHPDTCRTTWTAEALDWYANLAHTPPCATVALLKPNRTPDETRLIRERWPAVCWSTDGAEMRGRTERDC